MAAKSICDGCQARAPMQERRPFWIKPALWLERVIHGKTYSACSPACAVTICERLGVNNPPPPLTDTKI